MKSAIFLLTVLSATICLNAAEPILEWNYENWKRNRSVSQNGQVSIYGVPAKKDGVNGSTGVICGDKARVQIAFFTQCQDWKEFTWEMKFKLDDKVDSRQGNALFCYGKHSWDRAQFLLWITPKQQLEGRFTLNIDGKKATVSATSSPLKFNPRQYYTVRVASGSGSAMKIWLDGRLVAIREKKSFGFNDLVCKSPKWYPLLAIGHDLANLEKVYRPLMGIVDEIKLWNTFEEPTLNEKLTSAATAGDHLLLKQGSRASTGKFSVLDRPGQALGSFIRPEQKFLDAAAHAEIELTDKDLIVSFHCPVADGMRPEKSRKQMWSGELVEFFFRPSPEKTEYFQYAVNLTGLFESFRWTSRGNADSGFKSSSTFEVVDESRKWTAVMRIPRKEIGLEQIKSGQTVTMNFTRTGATGGGQSTWSSVGSNFHDIDCFRTVVFESRKDALRDELKKSRMEFEKIECTTEEKAKVAKELDKLAVMIEKNGNDSSMFNGFRRLINGMQARYTSLRFASIPALIWTQPFPWGNDIQVSSLSSKTEKISLVLPQNSYTFTSFVFSNLTEKPFLGQLKCFPATRREKKLIYNTFNDSLWSDGKHQQLPVYRNAVFFEAIPKETASGSTIYDPMSPLPMNTLIRAAGKESKQLWLRFSSEGMTPGLHKYILYLKPSCAGFQVQEIELNVDIRPVDCSGIKLDSGHYTSIYQHGAKEGLIRFLAEKQNNLIYTGCFGQRSLDIYPEVDKQGNVLRFNDYKQIDDMIDKTIRNGIAKTHIKLWCFLELASYGLARNGKGQLPYNSLEWKKAFKAFLADFTGHLEKKYGIGKDRIVFYPVDEPSGDINDPKSRMYQAYLQGTIIKEAGKDYRTMVNPLPDVLRDFAKKKSDLTKLLDVYDIIELYRPGITPAIAKWAKESGKTIWTYGIYATTVQPDVYRREYWQSLRDGFTEVITYWHLESHAGGDGFNPQDGTTSRADYGSIYADLNQGTVLSSRRHEAHDLGREDFRLAEYCRRLLKKKNNPSLTAKFDMIIKKAAGGNMEDMEKARLELLQLAEALQQQMVLLR